MITFGDETFFYDSVYACKVRSYWIASLFGHVTYVPSPASCTRVIKVLKLLIGGPRTGPRRVVRVPKSAPMAPNGTKSTPPHSRMATGVLYSHLDFLD